MRGVSHWRLAPVLVVGLLTFLALSIDGSSSATMTARTESSASVQAAADWTPPTVTMTKPAVPAKGTVTLSAQASDAETGIAGVAFQLQASGGAWTPICTDETAPYTCSWNTTAVADGDHSLRAVATDQAGYATTSASVAATVANSVFPVLDVPDVVRGTVVMPVVVHNPPGLYVDHRGVRPRRLEQLDGHLHDLLRSVVRVLVEHHPGAQRVLRRPHPRGVLQRHLLLDRPPG